jgi:ribonucleoside-diphosphate reductase alpha chain
MKSEKSVTIKTKTGCNNIFIIIVSNENNKIIKIFLRKGKSGMCFNSQLEALQNVINIALKCGADVEKIAKSLIGIRCPSPTVYEGEQILSCADAVGQTIIKFIKKEE